MRPGSRPGWRRRARPRRRRGVRTPEDPPRSGPTPTTRRWRARSCSTSSPARRAAAPSSPTSSPPRTCPARSPSGCSTGSRRSGSSTTRRSPGTGSSRGSPAGAWRAGPRAGAAPQGDRPTRWSREALDEVDARRRGRGRAGAGAPQAARRVARFDQATAVRRLTGMLARKGYPPGTAFRVVREELAAAEERVRGPGPRLAVDPRSRSLTGSGPGPSLEAAPLKLRGAGG